MVVGMFIMLCWMTKLQPAMKVGWLADDFSETTISTKVGDCSSLVLPEDVMYNFKVPEEDSECIALESEKNSMKREEASESAQKISFLTNLKFVANRKLTTYLKKI